jgi:predicted nucleic acid-binding protein
MTVRQQQMAEPAAESESVGSVRPGSREHLWAEYESAVRDWEKAGAAERAQFAAYEFATEIWHQKRAEERATWRRSREAFEAWRDKTDSEDRTEVR